MIDAASDIWNTLMVAGETKMRSSGVARVEASIWFEWEKTRRSMRSVFNEFDIEYIISMAKKSTMLFRLMSSAGTGFFYVGKKNVR